MSAADQRRVHWRRMIAGTGAEAVPAVRRSDELEDRELEVGSPPRRAGSSWDKSSGENGRTVSLHNDRECDLHPALIIYECRLLPFGGRTCNRRFHVRETNSVPFPQIFPFASCGHYRRGLCHISLETVSNPERNRTQTGESYCGSWVERVVRIGGYCWVTPWCFFDLADVGRRSRDDRFSYERYEDNRSVFDEKTGVLVTWYSY